MNKLTPIVLATLIGLTSTAFAAAPAADSGNSTPQAAPAVTVPHDAKATKVKAASKKHHSHRKQAPASAATSK